MFKTLSNSLVLAAECWSILMKDKEMLVYPALTSVVNIAILFMAFFYFHAIGFMDAEGPVEYSSQQWLAGVALTVVTLYACHFSFSFFECALVASAIKRLRGENPTLGYGLGIASNRIPQIAGWSFYVTVFGIFLSLLKRMIRIRLLQGLISGILKSAWNVATVFVMPLIVVENLGSTNAVKRSASLVREKWGEAVTLQIGFGWLFTISMVPVAFLFLLGAGAQDSSVETVIAVLMAAVVLGAFLMLIFAAL
ncbi:MAG: DUF6159 family protein, partial [Pseudomonadota bacterium]